MKKLTDLIIRKIAAHPGLFLFLDYDGTLTPIASGPSKARLSPQVRALLCELKAAEGVKIAIVSGRSLGNLKRYVRIPGILLVGNHGFEIRGSGISYVHPEALAQRGSMAGLSRYFKRELSQQPGFFVEHKKFSVSIHYRQVTSPRVIRTVKRRLFRKLACLRRTPVAFKEGKKVWELRPNAAWHKGKAVLWLARHAQKGGQRLFPVYVGDDVTDEDAFEALRKRGAGIKVFSGKRCRSHARFLLRSPGEVARFLRRLLILRTTLGGSHV